ncbi:MAG TPA: ATP-binding protein, partial [Gemmatimonadales bacterium]|nr:ATP-binding protein [Gemmatimonadales bacterium]
MHGATLAERLIDREQELTRLRELMQEGRPRLVLLYGRRRVGKTFLLTHAWPAARTFHFTAAATTPEQNRRQLIDDLARWTRRDLRAEDYPTWRAVFRLLLDVRSPEPVAIVVDEFQYLGDDAAALSGVASELNAVWEERRRARSLVFVLAGSAVRTMEALAAGAAPLHGRFAWKAELRPFDYWHAGQLAAFRKLRDRAYAYGVFGGTPAYLAAARPAQSVAANGARLMLAPRGEVRELVETALLQEQGLRDIPKYAGILRAVAGGHTELNAIAQAAGLPLDTSLRDKVERLIGLGYVRATRNFGVKRTAPFRYYLADPAFRFYYQFVAPHEAALERSDAARFWRERVASALDTYMGGVFERMAEQAYTRLRDRHGLPLVGEWGRWEGKDRAGEQIEIDVVCELADGRVMTGAVKWNRRPVGVDLHERHVAMLERLAASGIKWAHGARAKTAPLIYVAAGGFARDFAGTVRKSRKDVFLWSLEDLYGGSRARRARS